MARKNAVKTSYSWILCCILLLALNANARNEGIEVIVTDPYADIHTGAGRGYPVFHIVEKGQKIRLYKRRTDWYKVETEDGKIGWIKRDQLQNTLDSEGMGIDFSGPGWQDYMARRLEFGFLGGDFDGARSLTTYLGYHLTPNISGELKYTQAFGEFSTIHISPSSDIVQTEDREDPVLTVGGGFFIYLSRSFMIRLEYNNHTTLTTRETNEEVDEWKAGFSLFF